MFTNTPRFYRPGLIAIFAALALRRAMGLRNSRADRALFLSAASLALTWLSLVPLKILFGRTSALFIRPSFIEDGVFEFNFFHGARDNSFPSGHTAAICAVFGILWASHPRYRTWYVVIVALMSIALVLGDFHFVSDVIAGGFLGVAVAATVLWLSTWLGQLRRRAEIVWRAQSDV